MENREKLRAETAPIHWNRLVLESLCITVEARTEKLQTEGFRAYLKNVISGELKNRTEFEWNTTDDFELQEENEKYSSANLLADLSSPDSISVQQSFEVSYAINDLKFDDATVTVEPTFLIGLHEVTDDEFKQLQNDLKLNGAYLKYHKLKETLLVKAELEDVEKDEYSADQPLPSKTVSWPLQKFQIIKKMGDRIPQQLGKSIKVAHPDTGITDHTLLRGKFSNPDKFYGSRQKAYPGAPGFLKWPSHGTATASVIVGDSIGVAPGAQVIPMRTNSSVVYATLSNYKSLKGAIKHAITNNCNIMSMSLGCTLPSPSLERAINDAIKAGIICISAAGNYWPSVLYPARFKNVIAVAACDKNATPCWWSARGSKVNITSYGEGIWRATWKKIEYENEDLVVEGPVVRKSRGTSYATALTAGVCALWLEKYGDVLQTYPKSDLAAIFKNVITKDTLPLKEHKLPHLRRKDFGAGLLNPFNILKQVPPAYEKQRPYQPKRPDIHGVKRMNLTHYLDRAVYGNDWIEAFEYLELRLPPFIQHELITNIIASDEISKVFAQTIEADVSTKRAELITALKSIVSNTAANLLGSIKEEISVFQVEILGKAKRALQEVKNVKDAWMLVKYVGLNQFVFVETGVGDFAEEIESLVSSEDCAVIITNDNRALFVYDEKISAGKIKIVQQYALNVLTQLEIVAQMEITTLNQIIASVEDISIE